MEQEKKQENTKKYLSEFTNYWIRWAIFSILFVLVLFVLVSLIKTSPVRNFLENMERTQITKMWCDMVCEYQLTTRSFEYTVWPKSKKEEDSFPYGSPSLVKYFPEQKQCQNFCFKDLEKVDKSLFDEVFNTVSEGTSFKEGLFPELKDKWYYKLNNWFSEF